MTAENAREIVRQSTKTAQKWALRLSLAAGLSLTTTAVVKADFNPSDFVNFGNCQLTGDAATIWRTVPAVVGPCTENQIFTDSSGQNSYQHTVGGEFFRTNNREAFTNGSNTWEVIPVGFSIDGFGAGSVAVRANNQLFSWEAGQQPVSVVTSVAVAPTITVTTPGTTVTVPVGGQGGITNVATGGSTGPINITIGQ